MPNSTDLIESSNSYLKKIDYDNLDDADKQLVDALITAGSVSIEKYCSRKFKLQSFVEIHNGDGSDSLLVKNPPIYSLESITFLGSSDVVVDDSEFVYDPNVGEIKFNTNVQHDDISWFITGYRNIEVRYVGGFSSEVPQPIQYLTAQFVIEHFDRKEAEQHTEAIKTGDYFRTYGKNSLNKFIFTHKKMLDMYRNRFI